MTQPTHDLAAQMVREMLNKTHLSIRFSDADMAIMEDCARRYMEKAVADKDTCISELEKVQGTLDRYVDRLRDRVSTMFTEDELLRALHLVDLTRRSDHAHIVSSIRAERAGKDGRCNQCGATPIREVLDGDPLCQKCCDAWCRAEGRAAADREEPPHEH